MPGATDPRIVIEGDDWRIVRVVVPDARRGPEPDDDGVRYLIETADGADLMGTRRWTQLDTKTAGMASVVRLCHNLKEQLLLKLGEM